MMIKKILRVTAAVLLLMIFTTVSAFAIDFPCDGYLVGQNVHLRCGPDTSYGSYGTFDYGTKYQLLALEGNWYKVSTPLAACGYGYVSANYISTTAPSTNPGAVSYSGISANASAGQRVVQIAEQFLGLPYVYGGSTPAGFDCSGFTSYVYKQLGYKLNRVSADQIENGIPVSKSELMPGDLLLFKKKNASRIHHVGIYVGDGMMIHSPQTGDVIKYASIVSGYYNDCYYAARRIIY